MGNNFDYFKKISLLLGVFVVAIVFLPFDVFAAACQTTGTGNWSSSGTWTSCGGSTPQAADTVTILNTHVITLDINATTTSVNINAGGTLAEDNGGRILAVSAGWTNSGVFTAGNSTVKLTGTQTFTGNTTFKNFTIDTNSGSTRTITFTGYTATTTGNFVMDNSGVGAVVLAGGGIAVEGDITWDQSNAPSSNSTILYVTGSGNQNLITTGSGFFNPFVINKPSGTLFLPATITTTKNWTWISGTVDSTTNNSTVVFTSGSSYTITGTQTLNNVTFNTGASGSVTVAIASGTNLTVAGTLTMDNSSTGVISFSTGSITATGNILVDGADISPSSSANFIISGSNNQNLSITGSSVTLGGFASTTINKTGGILTISGVLHTAKNFTQSSSSDTVDWKTNNATLSFNGTSNFNSGSAIYNNIYIDTSGVVTLKNNLTIDGNWTNNGSFISGTYSTTFSGSGNSTVITGGTGTTQDFQNFTINKTGSGIVQLLTNGLDVDGTLTITSGTLDLNSQNISTTNTLSNSGILKLTGLETLSASSTNNIGSTVLYYGSGTSTISNLSNSFYNLTSSTAGKVLVFPSSVTVTVSGTLDLQGENGNNLVLKSSAGGVDGQKIGSASSIQVSTAGTLSYLTVYDSTVSGAAAPVTTLDSLDGGNNTGWTWGHSSSLVFSSISSGNISDTTATITWITDIDATSRVVYSVDTSYASYSALDATLTQNHSVQLSNLTSGTTYHYRVVSADSLGNTSTTSTDRTFTTAYLPTLTTQAASLISFMGATLNGTITDIGGVNPTVRGFVYGKTSSYGATTTESSASFPVGAFTAVLSTELAANTTYYFKAYASNVAGVSYGNNLTFTTSQLVSSGDTIYYVDYETGNDANTGISQVTPWKHTPGDSNATGNASRTLAAGDTVFFKGGVSYYGDITVNASGVDGNPITFDGNSWGTGTSTIDGSYSLTGWTVCSSSGACGGNSNWQNIYHTTVTSIPSILSALPEIRLNLIQDNQPLVPSQTPASGNRYYQTMANYYSISESNVTSTSITDTRFATLGGSSLVGSYIYIWGNPNHIYPVKILSYTPETNTVTFAETLVYTDRATLYSVANNISDTIFDTAGEYYFNPTVNGNGTYDLYVWPLNGVNLSQTGTVTLSTRSFGFDVNTKNYITIRGFKIQKQGGDTFGAGGAVIKTSGTVTSGIIASGNEITLENGEGFSSISLQSVTGSNISNNNVHDTLGHLRGIQILGGSGTVSSNTLDNIAGTDIYFSGVSNGTISNNTVSNSTSIHGNGISVYVNSSDISVFGNTVTNSNIPFTLQDSSNFTVYNNIFDGNNLSSNIVAAWSGLSGTNRFMNNIMINSTTHSGLSLQGASAVNIVQNNIIDGWGGVGTYNLYTGLSWSQYPAYGWYLGTGEIVETDLTSIFVDPSNSDYRLKAGSPANDVGLDLSAYFTTDKNGTNRPQNGIWDIGPYERVSDITPPQLSSGLPSGVQPSGTTQVVLSVTTDEASTCKYGTVANIAYAEIVNTFGSTGSTVHTQTITGLTDGVSYTYYIRCTDGINPNVSDYSVSFSVASGTTYLNGVALVAPVIITTPPPSSITTQVNKLQDQPFASNVFVRDLFFGMKGEDVKTLQEILIAKKYLLPLTNTGYFGPLTRSALVLYQRENRITPATGYFGLKTKTVLLTDHFETATPTPKQFLTKTLVVGMTDSEVFKLQEILKTLHGIYPEGLITGFFGDLTLQAVKRFQLQYKIVLSADDPGYGIVGPKTRAQLKELGVY